MGSENFQNFVKSLEEKVIYRSYLTQARPVRPSKDELFLSIAKLVSTRSTCSRMHVGCVLTDWVGEKIAIGYNGGPKGGRNKCAREGAGVCGDIHAEINAIINSAGISGPLKSYVTIAPCELCAIALVNRGVKELIVDEYYRSDDGLEVFKELNIPYRVLTPKPV